jgi:hypothetical protein
MGRYYSGDIEGKFWFGVQSSDDADFFGVEGQALNINYYFDEDNLEDVELGIRKCLETMGKDKERFDEFFKDNNGYNNEMIIAYYKEKYQIDVSDKFVRHILEWYARLQLGKQIQECIKENGECNFEAEL